MDTNKNLYTVIYATIMVVIVAVVLAFASSLLKERQQRNVEIERKQMILRSVHLAKDAGEVDDKDTYIEKEYAKFITDSSINENGKDLTLYLCKMESGEKYYIIPLHGVGLWGPVWGYLSLKKDFNTVYGATYDHKSETPGLGAEISTEEFCKQFEEKKIFDDSGEFVSVKVVKGGASTGSNHEVDAISGGTITSKAVESMLFNNIREYINFFANNLKAVREQEEIKAREAERAAMEAQVRAQFVADSIAKAESRGRSRRSQQNSIN